MTMPTRREIEQYARELWHRDRARSGDPSFDIEPELGELSESGYLSTARSSLMHNLETKNAEWKGYNENLENSDALKFDAKEGMATTTFISGSRGVGKSDVAMKISDQLTKEKIIAVVFDPSTDWVKRSGITQYVKADSLSDLPIPEHSIIIDTSMLTPMQQQQTVERFCKKLFEFQIGNSAKRFYLVFEESQIFFPLNSLRSLKTQNTMRILTTGRNFNVSLAAISQFPALIDKELVKHAGQIFIGYASEPNTLSYWKGILGKKAEDLKKLQNGQFVYFNRNNIGLTEIEPYESESIKTQIQIPEPERIEPIQHSHPIAVAKLFMLGLWCLVVVTALKGML